LTFSPSNGIFFLTVIPCVAIATEGESRRIESCGFFRFDKTTEQRLQSSFFLTYRYFMTQKSEKNLAKRRKGCAELRTALELPPKGGNLRRKAAQRKDSAAVAENPQRTATF
jgi:hypothetical protein